MSLREELARVATITGAGEGGVVGVSGDGVRLGVRIAVEGETRWLVAYVSVCPRWKLDSQAVLGRNAELVSSTIVPVGSEYVLRFVAPLDSAAAGDVAAVVTRLLDEARLYRPSSAPAASGDPHRMFAHFTD